MGVWIDAIFITYRSTEENLRDSESVWDEARRSKAVISAYIASDGQRINVARMKQRGDMREVFLSTVGCERDSSFEVSNLGVMSAGEQELAGGDGQVAGLAGAPLLLEGFSQLEPSRDVMGVCVWGLAGRRELLGRG